MDFEPWVQLAFSQYDQSILKTEKTFYIKDAYKTEPLSKQERNKKTGKAKVV